MQRSDDDIRAMLDAATPGNWFLRNETTICAPDGDDTDNPWVVAIAEAFCGPVAAGYNDRTKDNARLLCAAPDLAALALSRGEALAKAEIARLRDALRNTREAITDSDDCAALALIDTALGGDDA